MTTQQESVPILSDAALSHLRQRLEELEIQRTRLEIELTDVNRQIGRMSQTVHWYGHSAGYFGRDTGLVEVVRKLLRSAAGRKLTLEQVFEELRMFGFDFVGVEKPLDAIDRVMTLLVYTREVDEDQQISSNSVFTYIGETGESSAPVSRLSVDEDSNLEVPDGQK